MLISESSNSKLVEIALEYYEEAIDGIFDGNRCHCIIHSKSLLIRNAACYIYVYP